MCCFKDFKNFERFNNIIQIILTVAIRFIQTLPEDLAKERQNVPPTEEEEKSAGAGGRSKDGAKVECENEETTKEEEVECEESKMDVEEETKEEHWSADEKEKLLHLVTKIFLMNFPSYTAYKHIVHNSLEELSQHETSALNNYCEIADPESPLYLLRNVCFLCDSNGIQALRQCFENAVPETLPFNFAHLLINLIANLRMWMNIPTVLQYIIPLRSSVIRYMCRLSDADLRLAGNRSMTDLMWAAVKEPLDTHFTFDREGLALAYKYFTCSTLTIRLTGITQINNQINMYNESCNNESVVDAERFGDELAQWLLDKKIVEHIFGPNLHVEIIKQSQVILAFLAMEGRITNEHIDCIWAASQLKHCGKQVYDILIPLIKNLELQPNRHLLELVSSLDPSAHTESTLYLASALTKCIWAMSLSSHSHVHVAAVQQQLQPHLVSYTALKHDGVDVKGKTDKHETSSTDSGPDDDDRKRPRPKLPKKKRAGGAGMGVQEREGHESTSEEQCCAHHRHLPNDGFGSDSSLGVPSDLSEDSMQVRDANILCPFLSFFRRALT
ncbi:hypothetical protein C0Q70_13955 [Pomacea canaliculata]|uniref:UBP34/UBP24/USP9X/USP9Y-like ARM repeat region domain-containing protein n=1 Tax=Pomacea canaliculata TaxID=400727 RepID=A0A2T7NYM6_POMCA|nr:hypothetical protein C0Q70_13955 [Pomacea canaliculata]